MKALLRLTLAALILAGLTVPTFAETFAPNNGQPIFGSFELKCARICAVMLCPETKPNCGLLADGSCGCYSEFSIGIS